MALRLRWANPLTTPRTHGVEPRCIQTSGSEYPGSHSADRHSIWIAVFKLPAELIVEIVSYFEDPRHNIHRARSGRGTGTLVLQHVERLTVVRKLTMTCWHLRNMLFPLLWQYVEGCNLFVRYPDHYHSGMDPLENGLSAQCSYLIRNPIVGAYVQYVCSHIHPGEVHEVSFLRALSADLGPWISIKEAPKDLTTKFVDCLVRLPNLRVLEIFGASRNNTITNGLRRNNAQFPNIRELEVGELLAVFIGRCPNVESVTVTDGLSIEVLCSRREGLKKLKRVAGVQKEYVLQREHRHIMVGASCSLKALLWKSYGAVQTSRRYLLRMILGVSAHLL